MNIKELKSILKENNINFYTYWDKKRLVSLTNEHNLLLKTEIDKEKSKDVNYDRLKTIKKNPRKVMLVKVDIKRGFRLLPKIEHPKNCAFQNFRVTPSPDFIKWRFPSDAIISEY